MAQELINADPFCPVRLAQIENRGRMTDKYMIEIQEPVAETESDNIAAAEPSWTEVPGVGTVHSEDYKLVSNQQVHDMAQMVLQDTGMKFEPIQTFGGGHSEPLYWNGRRYSEKWYCPDTGVDVPGGSSMMLGLEVCNSYDGSSKVSLAFFAMHLVCSNQFYSNNMLGRPFEFPHVNRGGELTDDITPVLGQIQDQARNFARIVPNINALNAARVESFDHFLALRQNVKNETGTEIRDKALLDELTNQTTSEKYGLTDVTYDDPSTYWSIANAYTAITTHAVGGPRAASQSGRVVDFLLERALKMVA